MTLSCTCQTELNGTPVTCTILPINWIINHVYVHFDRSILNTLNSEQIFKGQKLITLELKKYCSGIKAGLTCSIQLKDTLGNGKVKNFFILWSKVLLGKM